MDGPPFELFVFEIVVVCFYEDFLFVLLRSDEIFIYLVPVVAGSDGKAEAFPFAPFDYIA